MPEMQHADTEQGTTSQLPPSQPSTSRRPTFRRPTSRRTPLVVAGVVVLALVLAAVVWRTDSGHGVPGVSGGSRTASYAAAGVTSVDLDGFNGRLTIGVGDGSHITATAGPADGHDVSGLAFRLDASTHVLTLACSSPDTNIAIACPASDYSVLVPPHVGVSLHELSGQANLSGLSGPVSITAITSGTLTATFASAPARVSVSVTSAQATLHLPAAATYDVRQRTVSGDVEVHVPQSAASPHTIEATATSGEVSLLAP
jgi:hypothetical protein